MRALLCLFAAASLARALEVPAGPLPAIDGSVGAEEWKAARALEREEGVARFLLAGGALCVSLEIAGPYQGERIDLHVSDFEGKNYVLHTFHPAGALSAYPFFPIVPAEVRRSSFSMRGDASPTAPRGCLARARVYRSESRWMFEAAIALDSLEMRPETRHVVLLEIASPIGEEPRVNFTPPQEGSRDTRGFEALRFEWPEKAEPFRTPEEDARRAFEFELFHEQVPGAETGARPLAEALGGAKSNARIDDLLRRLAACREADPSDFFARTVEAQVLRRANRLERAIDALDATFVEFPLADGSRTLLTERFHLLFSLGRFEEAAVAAKSIGIPSLAEAAKASVAAWAGERARREAEKSRLPRLELKTSKGVVLLDLFAEDAGPLVEHLVARLRSGDFDGATFPSVVGGGIAQISGRKPAAPAPAARSARGLWRGSLGYDGESLYLLLTRAYELESRLPSVGRVVSGMEAVDALEAGDRVESARLLP